MRNYVYNSVQVSGVSAASGRRSDQFDRKRDFGLAGFQVSGVSGVPN